MDVHRFESTWAVVSVIMIVAWIATVTYGAVGPGIAMVDDSGGTTDAELIAEENYDAVDGFQEPGVYATGDGEYEAYVIARQFEFEPGTEPTYDTIEVPAGSTVTFYVTSPDVVHGFEIVGTNVNTMVIPGQIAELTVEFEAAGTYGIVCNEYCGVAHHEMAGEIEVVPPSQFDGGA